MLSKNYPNSDRLKIIACIQARMGSKRLKKKALQKIADRTLIEHIFRRLKGAQELDGIVLTTSLKKDNDVLVRHAQDIGLKYYRGSEEDLVSRIYGACKRSKAHALVRITGDCPLVDPKLVDKMVRIYRKGYQKFDFVTNVFPSTFPDGLDVEILPLSTLKRLDSEIKNSLQREWLTTYIMENSKKFRIHNFRNSTNLSSLRWAVDYPEDLVFVREIFKALDKKDKIFTTVDILNFLKKNPQISKINAKWVDKAIAGGIRSSAYHALKKL